MKVVILGYGSLLTSVIAGVMDAGADIVGVLRHEKIKGNPLKQMVKDFVMPEADYNYIKSYNLHELKSRSANSEKFRKEILKLNPDIILVCCWSEKLKKATLDLPKIACINVHPGLLPQFRGPNPTLEVIRHLETQSGVTVHLMDENFDTGSILAQKFVDIEETDTGKELKAKVDSKAREAVGEVLLALKDDFIIPLKQNEKKANYYPAIDLKDTMIDFNKSAKEISAQIRGLHPWYKCYFEYGNEFFTPNPYRLRIEPAKDEHKELEVGSIVFKNHKKCELGVLTGDGNILYMQKLKLFGKVKQFFTRPFIKYLVVVN